jgi:hypothetical protein
MRVASSTMAAAPAVTNAKTESAGEYCTTPPRQSPTKQRADVQIQPLHWGEASPATSLGRALAWSCLVEATTWALLASVIPVIVVIL